MEPSVCVSLVFWLVFGAISTGIVYDIKGKNITQGFIVGAIVGPFGGMLLLILFWLFTQNEKTCPYCEQTIKKDIFICRHCGMDVDSIDTPRLSLLELLKNYLDNNQLKYELIDTESQKVLLQLTEFQYTYLIKNTIPPIEGDSGWYVSQELRNHVDQDNTKLKVLVEDIESKIVSMQKYISYNPDEEANDVAEYDVFDLANINENTIVELKKFYALFEQGIKNLDTLSSAVKSALGDYDAFEIAVTPIQE